MSELTHGADLWEDGYPHGTVEGYNDGCRGAVCPGGIEWGLSCKRAKMLAAGDYRYNRLVKDGLTPAEIAAIIDGHETPTPAVPAPKETPAMSAPTPAPKPAPPKKPLTVEPVPTIDDVTPAAVEQAPARPTDVRSKEELATIRHWAQENGVKVGSRGLISAAVIVAYDEAHRLDTETSTPEPKRELKVGSKGRAIQPSAISEPVTNELAAIETALATGNDFTDALDEARERATDENAHPATAAEIAEIFGVSPDDIVDHSGTYQNAEQRQNAVAAEIAEQLYAETHPHTTPDDVVIEITVDTSGFEAAVTAAANAEPRTPRPEWADVAISQDVERARRIAVALEQELARTEQLFAAAAAEAEKAIAERDQALAALELTLKKWNTERFNAGALRITLAIAQEDTHHAWRTCDMLAGNLSAAESRTDTLVQLLRDRQDDDRDRRRGIWGRIFG